MIRLFWFTTIFLLILDKKPEQTETIKTIQEFSPAFKQTISQIKDNALNYENLEKEIIEQEIMFPDIVMKQALLESGQFTSNICKIGNNLFGMRVPRQRPKSDGLIGEYKYHAQYDHWKSSVEDYKLWQSYMIRIGRLDTTSKYTYYNSLDNFYATGENYSLTLKTL